MTLPGIEPRSPGQLDNTLPIAEDIRGSFLSQRYYSKNKHKNVPGNPRFLQRYHCPAWKLLGARGVMVIVGGNGHSDTSSNPGRD